MSGDVRTPVVRTPVVRTPVVRTVLGDVPAGDLGVTYAHEHLIIDGGIPTIISPHISLQSVEDAVAELATCAAAGVRTVVDAMPADAGRNVTALAEVSRRSGVAVVVATGFHHERYYGERHWSVLARQEEVADLLVADVVDGVDAHDYNGPVVRRTPHRAGIVKVAGSEGGPSARDRRVIAAAVEAVCRTGAPVLTHCEGGTGALEILALLADLGVPPARVALSHTDKVEDPGYHRAILATGANVVHDQGLRDAGRTERLVVAAVEAGHGGQVMLGTDGARRTLWRVLGGSPGLAALRTAVGARLAAALGEAAMARIWVANPARWLALAEPA